MEVSKIYRVIYQTWSDHDLGNDDYKTWFEGNYIDKEYAKYIYDIEKKKHGSGTNHGVYLNEIDVIFNQDGSYQEITINNNRKWSNKMDNPEYQKYREEKVKQSALAKLTAEERKVLGL